MNFQNKDRIERMVIQLESILETDKDVNNHDADCIQDVLISLRKISGIESVDDETDNLDNPSGYEY